MRRVNVSVDGTVFDEFSSQAQNQNRTLFAFTNEWLSAVTKLSNDGWSPSKLYDVCHSISLLREMDVITLPSDSVDELVARQYKTDKEGLLKIFADMGSEIASVLKIVAPDIGGLAKSANEFIALLPLKIFDLSIRENGDTAEISIVGAGRRIESTECALQLLVSIFDSYGYIVTNPYVTVGTIRFRARRISPEAQSQHASTISKQSRA